jgi:hypothetical protein
METSAFKPDNYGIYSTLLSKGKMDIDANMFSRRNIDDHFNYIINLLSDGIETEQVQRMMINLKFVDGVNVELTIFEYLFNLMFYTLPLEAGEKIDSDKLFWCEDITEEAIGKYINDKFIKRYRTTLPFIELNQTIDTIFCKFRDIKKFQWYLMNTVNLEDTCELMDKYPEFYEAVHCDASGVPIEDVKAYGMKATNVQIDYITNSDHCLRDSFRTGEAVSAKQFKEVQANIGSKPNGRGGVYPVIINSSFLTGGLVDPTAMVIESSIGRQAQILAKNNVGFSGNFARLLGLNCENTSLHEDPNYSCDTRNFIKITIEDKMMLKSLDMRYYKKTPNYLSLDHLIDAEKDTNLIGQTIYLRSPMTCNSFAHGKGICYKCYGNLAYVNNNVNVGKISAEELSSRFTQRLLSAKHLLESMVEKMEWVGPLYDYFEVYMDCLCLRSDVNFTDIYLKLSNIETEDEYDNTMDFNYHVTEFTLILPDKQEVSIYTTEADNIYLQPEISDIVLKKVDELEDDDSVIIPLIDFVDIQNIFHIQLKNNELQATMDEITKLINTTAKTRTLSKDELLYKFLTTNIKGGITINCVHHEVLIANQIRSIDNVLEYPDWGVENQEYQILTLNNSLMDSPYLMTRLLYSKLHKVLITPSTFEVTKPSVNDLFAMVNPFKYLHSDPSELDQSANRDVDEETVHAARRKVDPIHYWNSQEEYEHWLARQKKNRVK